MRPQSSCTQIPLSCRIFSRVPQTARSHSREMPESCASQMQIGKKGACHVSILTGQDLWCILAIAIFTENLRHHLPARGML